MKAHKYKHQPNKDDSHYTNNATIWMVNSMKECEDHHLEYIEGNTHTPSNQRKPNRQDMTWADASSQPLALETLHNEQVQHYSERIAVAQR